MRLWILLLLVSVGFVSTAAAETRYIVDQAKLPMRAGKSTDFKIIRMLPSGMAVELLEQSNDGYSRIRIPDGRDGWILSRYLMTSPAARDRLQRFEKELAELGALKRELGQASSERERLQRENRQLTETLEQLRRGSRDAVQLVEQNRSLRAEAAEAKRALQQFRTETDDITSSAHQRWFMLGGGAVLIGVVLGLLLPHLRFRRRRRWGDY